jgi:hypothetical protein
LEIPEARKSVEEMLVADFLIANQDRHTLNFGALRNADSLKFEGMAPIFDSGSSLSHDSVNICPSDRCMPFREWHEEQIRLVEDFSFLDFSALKGLCPHLGELLARSPWISAERGGALCHALQNRARLLKDTITEIKGQASLDLEPLRFKVY